MRYDNMSWIKIKQYLRPNGAVAWPKANVEDDLAEFVIDNDIVITAELISDEEVAITAKYPDWPDEAEFLEIADNGPGEKEPTKMIEKVLRKLIENGPGCPLVTQAEG
jgi:hypothetical protein